MARSPWKFSQTTKVIKMRTKPTSRPITTLLFQGCVWPPYWRARIKEMMPPMTRVTPTGSNCRNFSFGVAGTAFAWAGV